MVVLKVKDHSFNRDYLKSVTLQKALNTLIKEPKEVVEEAWRIANGQQKKKRKTTTTK
jgi:hypothetical protein